MKTSQNWLRDLLRIIIIFFKLLKKKKSERWLGIRTPDKKTVGRKRPLTSAGTDRRNRAEFEPASAAASAASSRSAHSARRTSPPSSASSCTWPCGKRGVRMTSHAAPQRRWRPADDRTIRFWRRRPPTPPGSNDPNKPTANRRRRRPIRRPLRSLRHLGGGGGEADYFDWKRHLMDGWRRMMDDMNLPSRGELPKAAIRHWLMSAPHNCSMTQCRQVAHHSVRLSIWRVIRPELKVLTPKSTGGPPAWLSWR